MLAYTYLIVAFDSKFHLFFVSVTSGTAMGSNLLVRWLLQGFLVYVACVCVAAERVPIRRTPLGNVKGFYMKTRGGREISAFTAIPYAVPPINELRFKVCKSKFSSFYVYFSHFMYKYIFLNCSFLYYI